MCLLIYRIQEKIKENVKNEKYVEVMTSGFSTTTSTNRINYQLSLMSSLQEFFEYTMALFCGIPSVIMDGDIKDWETLGVK